MSVSILKITAMKKSICLIAVILLLLGCNQQSNAGKTEQQISAKDSIGLQDLITLTDAEKILGEPAHITDSTLSVKKELTVYQCAYSANASDTLNGKTGVIFILIEQYAEESEAHNKYANIKKANENHEGIKTLNDMGDEAYFHSDYQNFYFVMARKGKRVLTMKVNKITSTTSLDSFNWVAKNITTTM